MTPINNSVLWSDPLDFYMMNDSDSDSNHSDINTTIDFDSDKCPDNHMNDYTSVLHNNHEITLTQLQTPLSPILPNSATKQQSPRQFQ